MAHRMRFSELGKLKTYSVNYGDRITFKSRIVKPLEAACRNLIQKAAEQEYKTRGPVRIPTKKLHITTRKAPSGEGTNTWDHFEMKIHKRVIDLFCPSGVIKEVGLLLIFIYSINLSSLQTLRSIQAQTSILICSQTD